MILCEINKTALIDNLVHYICQFYGIDHVEISEFTKNLNFFSTPLSDESSGKVIGSYK